MRVELMQVGDRQSLEMDAAGLEAVQAHIEQTYPDLTTRIAGIVTLVRFGGSEFLFENEWDAPYFLAKTAAGDEVLRLLCRHFS